MLAMLKKPIAYLSTSFFLFLIAVPLISIGTTSGPSSLLWAGLAALCIGGVIPPAQRLLTSKQPPAAPPPNETAD
jgi:hypothetical protein